MMPKIKGGYYLKARIIQEKKISKAPPHTREVWDYILREANHKDNKYGQYTIKRGQLFRTYQEIRESLAWFAGWRKMMYSENQMKASMKFLRDNQCIATTKQPGGTIITILNYDHYQNPKNYEATKEATKEHAFPPRNNKNDKECKNYIINYLNEKTGKKYKTTTPKTMRLINARLKEGFSLNDFKTVIKNKTKEWKNTDMAKYLRPETLFGTKFESYLQSVKSTKKLFDIDGKELTPEKIKEMRDG